MHLSPPELRELAAFLSRRLTPEFRPVHFAYGFPQGTAAVDAWVTALDAAQRDGGMGALLRRVRGCCPADAAVQEACTLLEPRRERGPALVGAAMVAAAAGGLGFATLTCVAVLGGLSLLEAWEVPATTVAVSARAPRAEGLPDPGDDRPGAEAPRAAADPMGRDADVPDRVEDGPPDRAPGPGARSLAIPERGHGKCRGRPGEAVGYWYAGRLSPGELGSDVDPGRNIFVRAEYPNASNGWDSRSRVVCALAKGDRVRLSLPPIVLPGGHIWVPLVDGDVGAADSVADGQVDDDR